MSDRKHFIKKRRIEFEEEDDAPRRNYFNEPGPSSRPDPPPLVSEDRRQYYAEVISEPDRPDPLPLVSEERRQYYAEAASEPERPDPLPLVSEDRRQYYAETVRAEDAADRPPRAEDAAGAARVVNAPYYAARVEDAAVDPSRPAAAPPVRRNPQPPLPPVPPPVRFVNLAPDEQVFARRDIPPVNVHLGGNVFVELKMFRRASYVGFYKSEDGVIRNRFNLPLSMIDKVSEAFEVIKQHARDSMSS